MTLTVTVTPIEIDKPENLETQRDYARLAVNHGLLEKSHFESGNSPFHGDLIYHQMFDLNDPQEVDIYKAVGRSWQHDAEEAHVYVDLGITEDMIDHINDLIDNNLTIKFKTLSNKKTLVKALDNISNLEEMNSFLKEMPNNIFEKGVEDYKNKIQYTHKPDVQLFNPEILNRNHSNGDFKRIIMESPFAGDVSKNVIYAKALMHNLSHKGYAPSASHLLYTQMLDDTKEFDRNLGINKGLDYAHNKDSIIGIDRGVSGGMIYGIKRAMNEERSFNFTTLSKDENIIKEVDKLSSIEEAQDFVKKQISKNENLYKETGYIHSIPSLDNFQKNKIKRKNINLV
jgi:hypothetical protein